MAKDKLSEYDATAANNTVVGDVNLAENSCLPSDVNNAIREVMSHQKEAFGSATPLFVDQTNNRLGISTLSPNNKLDVNGGIVCSPNTDGKNTFELSTSAVDEGRLRIKNVDTTTVQIRAGGLSYFNGGNVAIGSTSASTVLDVEGAGVPLTINSNNSNQYKIQILDAGTVRSYLGASSTASFVVANSSVSEAMRITSGGLVAIGNSTPDSFNANAKNLVVGTGSGSNGISIFAGNTSDSAIFFADNGSTATGQINYKHADNAFTFHTNSGTERMRIDSSGNLLVGGTETNPQNQSSGAGSALRADGRGLFRCADANALAANRTGSDGEIIRIGRDGSTIAQIKSISGPQIALVQGSTGLAFYNGGNQIYPTDGSGNRDATIDLGYSSSMFKDGYFSGTVFAEAFTGRADTDTSIQMAGSNRIKFFTASSERMRIDDDDILFGTSSTSLSDAGIKFANTSATHKYAVFTHTASSASESLLYINRQSSDGTAIFFRRANTNVGSISVDSSSTSYNTSSDRRLKSNIQDAESASDKIDALQVRQFDWNVDGSHQDFGLVAQELQPIAPNAVLGDADSDEMMSVDYSKLVPLLIKFSQEQQATIKSLETRLAALES